MKKNKHHIITLRHDIERNNKAKLMDTRMKKEGIWFSQVEEVNCVVKTRIRILVLV